MSRALRTLVSLLVLASLALAQSKDLDAARRRWEELSPEQRRELQARYRDLRDLGAEERGLLKERALKIEAVKERLLAGLEPTERQRLEALPRRERDKLLRDMVRSEIHRKSDRIRRRMPRDLDEGLGGLERDERRRRLHDFKHGRIEELGTSLLRRMGQKLSLPRAEVERMTALEGRALTDAIVGLGRRLAQRAPSKGSGRERRGPPHPSLEDWNRWADLEPKALFDALLEHRRKNAPSHARAERRPGGPNGPGRGPGREGQGRSRRGSEKRRGFDFHPRPEDWLDFAKLDSKARHEAVFERVRTRFFAEAPEAQKLTEAQTTELKAMQDLDAFRHAVRRFLGPPRGPGQEGPRGPREGLRRRRPPGPGGPEGRPERRRGEGDSGRRRPPAHWEKRGDSALDA